MQTHFVRVECDVTAKVLAQPFRYRAYVGDELFAERTWIWENCYLEENFQIQALPGIYPIRFETVDPVNGRIKVRNFRTDVEIIMKNLKMLQHHLDELKIRGIDKHGIDATEQQINSLNQELQSCIKTRTVKIIDYQGQPSLEISDASK